jgi:hypothetical protein
MKKLLIVTAVLEIGAGLVLLVLPAPAITFLFGSALRTPIELVLARMAGVALGVLGVACWLARADGQSRAARGLVGGMTLYNAGIATVLAYAGIGLALAGIGLWPAVLLHLALTGWCFVGLRHRAA